MNQANTDIQRKKIVITGGAGLVGQNLVVELKDNGYTDLHIIDKNKRNLEILQSLHPEIKTYEADVSQPGEWREILKGAVCVAQLHAQIAGTDYAIFERNNIAGTKIVLETIKDAQVPYLVHISSSVVVSKANDFYTNSKKEQERIVEESGIPHCTLRPTLMFGWFDPKHLGWLGRLMAKVPVFPIPGDGKFLRQPLYARDFARMIRICIERQPKGIIYDVVGPDEIDYVDIIRSIKRVRKLRTVIFHIPYKFFSFLLKMVALVHPKPPFTAQQLDALSAGDYFRGVNIQENFGFAPTPFSTALTETWNHPVYSAVVLDSTH